MCLAGRGTSMLVDIRGSSWSFAEFEPPTGSTANIEVKTVSAVGKIAPRPGR